MVRGKDDIELIRLGGELSRLQRRARRLKRALDHGSGDWADWSAATDAAFALVDRIVATPAHGLSGVSAKISAIVWFLNETDAVLDSRASRQLVAIAREARLLVRASTAGG
jgi:hypothetical protein